MQSKLKLSLAVALAGFITLAVRGQEPVRIEPIEVGPIGIAGGDRQANAVRQDPGDPGPVNPIGIMTIPGGIISSIDIMFVDQDRGRLYLADRTNKVIDIFDAVNDAFVGQVGGFIASSVGGIANAGPNGVLVTPDNILWAGDSNNTVQVADLNLSPPRIIRTIPIGTPSEGRADELAYDPIERLILMASDASTPPRVTFISADSYQILGKIDFPDADGLEQPVWDQQLHRFLINVPGPTAYEAVIDPRSKKITKRFNIPDCKAAGGAGVNGLALGPLQQMLVVACTNVYIMNAIDGHIMARIPQVGGADEVWYNAGDNRYYVAGADRTGVSTGALGVIDAGTNKWLQNVPSPRTLRNVAAYQGNNQIFAGATRPPVGTPDTTICAAFGSSGTGCIVVFSHL